MAEQLEVNAVQDAAIGEFQGDEMDDEFRKQECVEVQIDSEDDVPPSDDDDDAGMDDEPDEEIGVVPEGAEEPWIGIDNSLTKVMHTDSVLSVAINKSNPRSIATSGQDDVAVLWTIEETPDGVQCAQVCRLEGHTDSVVQIAFSHDGQLVATGGYDGAVRVWNAASGALVHALEGPAKEVEWISWHPKGHALLAGSSDTMAWMWWAPTGKLMQIFAGHAQSVTCGCWPMQGKLICTGSDDNSMIVWNPRAGTPQQHLKQLHEGSITCICAHPDAPVVVTGSEDSTAKVIQIETGKVLAVLGGHTDSIETVQFSKATAQGLLLLCTGSMDGKVTIWDGKTFGQRHVLSDHFEKGGVTKCKWVAHDVFGNLLCTASADQTLRIFDGLAGQCLQTLSGHADTIFDLDLCVIGDPGSQKLCLFSGSDDKSARLFILPLPIMATAAASSAPAGAPAVC